MGFEKALTITGYNAANLWCCVRQRVIDYINKGLYATVDIQHVIFNHSYLMLELQTTIWTA